MRLFANLEINASKEALLTSSGHAVSYHDLAKAADGIASKVHNRAVVIAICQNTVPSVTGYVGFIRNSIVPILVSPNQSVESIQQLASEYQADYLWGPLEQVSAIDGASEIFQSDGYVLRRFDNVATPDIDESLAVLLTTSGSTGSPVLVRQSHSNLLANTESIVESLSIRSDDRPITTLPMNYTYGLSILNSHLESGCTILLNDAPVTDRAFWDFMKVGGATTFGGVPYTYEVISRLGFEFLRNSTIKYLTQAGGRLKPELVRSISRKAGSFGVDFYVMYGQTEATARMSVLPPHEVAKRPGSIGKAIPGGMFWLLDDDGTEITAANTPGELVYSGANVTMGYAADKRDLAKGDENLGILYTGDLAFRDEDGFYFIVGRKKRFIKIFGNRVNLDDVERYLEELGFEGACVGTDDRLTVFIVPPCDLGQVKTKLSDFLRVHPTSIQVSEISSLPRSDSGKLLYSALM